MLIIYKMKEFVKREFAMLASNRMGDKRLNRNALGIICIILSAVLFGWMPFLAKIAYDYGGNAYTVSLGRFLFGTVVSAMVLMARHQSALLVSTKNRRHLFLLSMLYAATPLSLYESYHYIGTGLATALHFTYPVFVMLLMRLLFHVSFTGRGMVCMILSILGVFLLCDLSSGMAMFGLFIAVLSGVLYASYIVLVGKTSLIKESVFVLTFWICLLASVELAIVTIIDGRCPWPWSWQECTAEFCLGLFSTVMALPLFQKGVLLCGEVKASLFSTFEPITSILIGIAVFGEAMNFRIASGVLLVLFAVCLLAMSQTDKCGQRRGDS